MTRANVLILNVAVGRGEADALTAAGLALAEAGHGVTIAANPVDAARARALGLTAIDVGRATTPRDPSYWDTVRETLLDVHRGPRRWLRDHVLPSTDEWLAVCLPHARTSSVILTGALGVMAAPLAARAGIPWVRVVRSPAWLAEPLDSELLALLPPAVRGLLVRARRARRTPSPPPALQIAAFSRQLTEQVPRTRGPVVQIGALHTESPTPRDPALEAFLAGGPAPVLLTLGSTPAVARPGALYDAFAEAVSRVPGRRGILLVDRALAPSLRPRFARSGLFVAGGAAYGDVMPHCQAVVHHGGAGATDAALEAGVPTLMIAHAHHQRVHAALAEARGIARALRPGALTADRMAAELDVLSDARFAARARALQTARRSERAASALTSAIAAI